MALDGHQPLLPSPAPLDGGIHSWTPVNDTVPPAACGFSTTESNGIQGSQTPIGTYLSSLARMDARESQLDMEALRLRGQRNELDVARDRAVSQLRAEALRVGGQRSELDAAQDRAMQARRQQSRAWFSQLLALDGHQPVPPSSARLPLRTNNTNILTNGDNETAVHPCSTDNVSNGTGLPGPVPDLECK